MFKSQIGGLALNRRKWPEVGPEWSPGPENRPPGMPRPFPSLWDGSRGLKPATKVKKLPVWGLALGSHLCGQVHAPVNMLTSSIGCANRSCGPPKPGRLLLSGVRRCRRGPDGAPEGPWGRRGVPRGSEHQLCTNTGQSSDPLDD